MAGSDEHRDAIEVAARPMRELVREEHDEIVAAQRALRHAEKEHDRAIAQAERELRTAGAAKPLAAYDHHVILYADRVSTADGNHDLTPEVSARVVDSQGSSDELTLRIEAPTWHREVVFPREDERKVRQLAEKIELAARDVDQAHEAAKVHVEQADQELSAAIADRDAVQKARALIHTLSDLVAEDENVEDMAPGINAGHDGVLVVTDRRLLFVGVRWTLSFPYAEIESVRLKGRWFGSRLEMSMPTGKGVVSGLAKRHAADIAELVGKRIRSG